MKCATTDCGLRSASFLPLVSLPPHHYNRGVQKSIQKITTGHRVPSDSIILGTVYGLLAAVGYTAANVFLRSAVHTDPYWVSAVKAVPTVLLFGPLLLVRAAKAMPLAPPGRPMAWLAAAAVVGQLCGNVAFQWSLGVIGIALTVPLCLGTMIMAGAWLGWSSLGEGVTRRTAISIVLLVLAVSVLSLGAPAAHASLDRASSGQPLLVAAGVVAACLAGFAYAALGVAIRNAARHGCPATTSLVTVGLAGVLALMPIAWYRVGFDGMLATDGWTSAMMVGAGLCNAGAFLALTKSLQSTSVVHVNGLNATQAAMAAVAGVLLFAEPPSAALGSGVVLTAAGLLLMDARPRKIVPRHDAETPASPAGMEASSSS